MNLTGMALTTLIAVFSFAAGVALGGFIFFRPRAASCPVCPLSHTTSIAKKPDGGLTYLMLKKAQDDLIASASNCWKPMSPGKCRNPMCWICRVQVPPLKTASFSFVDADAEVPLAIQAMRANLERATAVPENVFGPVEKRPSP